MSKQININKIKLKTTEVYDSYWKFAAERQNIFFNRYRKATSSWTEDSILKKYKFTNTYRASDRVSQYLIKNVIYTDNNYTPEDQFFRIILFKLFNKISTWEYIENCVGEIKYEDYKFEMYDTILTKALSEKKTIYSAAYIMPSGNNIFGYKKKHQNNLKLLEKMMNDKVPKKIASLRSMKELYELLLSYPTIGKFLAFQYCIDINYSDICDFSEMSFVIAGPGAKNGIRKCFEETYGWSDEDIIKYMALRQEEEFSRLGLEFKSLWGRPLQLIDCQNIFCETDKYARVAFPEIKGAVEKKRIKQLFVPNNKPIEYFYPPKWGINKLMK